MDIPENTLTALFDAGRDALTFNAPLRLERAIGLVEDFAQFSVDSAVDFGCGRGELVRMIATRLPQATVTGIDTDKVVLGAARSLTAAAGLDGRVRFELADASDWAEPSSAAVCVGASYAFGGPSEMFARLAELVPRGPLLIGDGFWQTEPSSWCLETFGEMPDGVDGLAAEAVSAGWTVTHQDSSTLDEWDDFEGGWVAGVRGVGTKEADFFAASREADYQNYRGVLGFGWLLLQR